MAEISYNESDIVVTKGLEGLRLRPSMYIGNIENGRFSILKEILDNALDEATAGYSSKVGCILLNDGKDTCIVYDEGRGIPVGPHPNEPEKSTLEIVFTQLHAGGKLKKGAYAAGSTGTHGVGSSATNALSIDFKAWTFRDGNWWTQSYSKGVPTSKVEKSLTTPIKIKKGTIVQFTPDDSILKKPLDHKQVYEYLENCSYLNSGVSFELQDKSISNDLKVFKSNGLIDFVKSLTYKEDDSKYEELGKPFIFKNQTVDVVLQWFESDSSNLTTWVNSNKTIEGGTHLNGLIRLINTAFGNFARKKNYKSEDLRVGLYGGLNLKISEPQFDSQTKEKLINLNADKLVYDNLIQEFTKYLEKNKSFVKRIIDRANEMRAIYNKFANEKKALSKIKTKGKQALPPPSKFIVSNCKDDNMRELYLCLAGDTEIIDVNGKSYKIRDLAENSPKEFYGFGVDEITKDIRPTRLSDFRKTRENTDLVRIYLDNDTYFDCTPDHKILCKKLVKGKLEVFYTEAKDLQNNQSLVNLTLFESDSGYLSFYQPTANYARFSVHQKVFDYYIGKRDSKIEDIHHKNEIKFDNYPSNLIKLTHEDHSARHRVLAEYWQDLMHCKKQSEVIKKYFSNPLTKKKHSEKMKEVMKTVDFTKIRETNSKLGDYRASKKFQHFKDRTLQAFENYKKTGIYKWEKHQNLNLQSFFINKESMDLYFKVHLFNFEDFFYKSFKESSIERLLQIANACLLKYGKVSFKLMQEFCINEKIQRPLPGNIKKYFQTESELEEKAKVYNHKVIKVEFLDKKEDTYCCKSDTHNFFLKNGVCVHNCEGESAGGSARQARDPHYQEILKLRGKIINSAKTTASKVYESEDIINILKAIGFDPVNKEHHPRVGKVIFLTDADVDGCLDGDTRILTLDGKNPTIRELTEKFKKDQQPIKVYSIDQNRNLIIANAINPRITRIVDEYIELTLSNNKKIQCTLDHKWLINNPDKNDKTVIWINNLPYKLAKDLTETDLLCSDRNFNFFVKEKHFIKETKNVYCMTVPKYHNFMIDDGNGNGICSANSHISTLLLTLIKFYYPELLTEGKVFALDAPLFIGKTKTRTLYGDNYQDLQKQAGKEKIESITRLKGWGEASPSLLKRLAFDPETRQLIKINDVSGKDFEEFKKIVGEDTETRKKLLEEL